MRKLHLASVVVGLCLLPAAAMATTDNKITLKYNGCPGAITMSFTNGARSTTVYTGYQALELLTTDDPQKLSGEGETIWALGSTMTGKENRLLKTYCIDFSNSASSGFVTYDVFDDMLEGPIPNPMSERQAGQLAWLWDNYFAVSMASGTDVATRSAAFQAATWEILNENENNTLDLTTGDFTTSNSNAAVAMANTWLGLALTEGIDEDYETTTQFYILSNPTTQDYMYLVAGTPTSPPTVPEPATMAGLGSAVLAAGAYLKRRRRQS